MQGTNTLTQTNTYQGTHSIFAMPAKAWAGTDVIPLLVRSSVPPCVGQEPDRTSGAPSESPLKAQLPNPTVQGKAEALLDAARSQRTASRRFVHQEVPMAMRLCLRLGHAGTIEERFFGFGTEPHLTSGFHRTDNHIQVLSLALAFSINNKQQLVSAYILN
jgi:hypothetical protein